MKHEMWGRVCVALLSSLAAVLAGCSSPSSREDSSPHIFGYAVDRPLLTTNVGSSLGRSTNAHELAGRLYPGIYVTGPEGQTIPNSDLMDARLLPGAQQRVQIQISDKAVYSDGAPITCDSFLLAFTAATQRPIFDSAMPLYQQVDSVECVPGGKLAIVVFKDNFGERWRHLFNAGTLLPAHAIAAKLDMPLDVFSNVLKSRDPAAMEPIAQIWNTGFNLDQFDPELQISSGPLKIESIGSSGEVTLVRNERYFGEKSALERLIVWPSGSDIQTLAGRGDIQIAEVASTSQASWVNRNDPNNPFTIIYKPGVLSEQLVLGSGGIFADPENRRAFAACIDQPRLAHISKEFSGVDTPATTVRTVRPQDPVHLKMRDITDPHRATDIPAATRISGQTVRIGYFGPDKRKAAMVQAIADSCQDAGVSIVDVSREAPSLGNLSEVLGNEFGVYYSQEGGADANLLSVDPMLEFPIRATSTSNIGATREAEQRSWDLVPSIPIAVEPRIYIIDKKIANVVENTDLYGLSWNIDRWQE
ncbi:ABC transporter substrate-binding protein [Corynebacterium sp. ES2730-CONJ]|uniref:ABC transporter substrate-binding protein n=1 Tax=Corynebacterium sp. ES2730-CONJ TaxID=2973941 RepID=UPI00216AFA89|nr:ABC transporter substrate-binding protein [Corynebacterium sp. ES2730-CONJ]MCS4531077.1 ABC transporter substrate-binding protein [Corynebacterium sp. ES2730-CONJ]